MKKVNYILLAAMFGVNSLSSSAQEQNPKEKSTFSTFEQQTRIVRNVNEKGPLTIKGQDADGELVSFMGTVDAEENVRLTFLGKIASHIVYEDGVATEISASEAPIILLDGVRPSFESLRALQSETLSDISIITDEDEAMKLFDISSKTGIVSIRK